VHLKPTNFFTQNPTLDIPASTQNFNQSKLVTANATGSVLRAVENDCSRSRL
jgi:hypothetical protein